MTTPQAIGHIIWDWNGTLLDDVEACVAAINRMIRVRNLPHLDRERYARIFTFPVKRYYRDLGFDLATENWDSMAKEFHRHYDETARDARLRRGILAVLDTFRERNLPMSILSASERTLLERMLADHAIRDYFQHVYGLGNLYASSKRDLGHTLIDRIETPASDTLLIGDTIHDFEVARELGCRCVLLAGGHQATDRIAGCACPIVHDVDALLETVIAWAAR